MRENKRKKGVRTLGLALLLTVVAGCYPDYYETAVFDHGPPVGSVYGSPGPGYYGTPGYGVPSYGPGYPPTYRYDWWGR